MSGWRNKLLTIFASDERVVRKIDELEKRQREIGHDLNNLQMKLDPLYKMVQLLEEDNPPPKIGKQHGN